MASGEDEHAAGVSGRSHSPSRRPAPCHLHATARRTVTSWMVRRTARRGQSPRVSPPVISSLCFAATRSLVLSIRFPPAVGPLGWGIRRRARIRSKAASVPATPLRHGCSTRLSAAVERGSRGPSGSRAFSRSQEGAHCAVPVLYLILRLLVDLAVSGGSDPTKSLRVAGSSGLLLGTQLALSERARIRSPRPCRVRSPAEC
jgi:hypothetical protein